MALRLRRGTNAQRQLITPSEGELIYVTDTTEIWVGDGTTLGGIRITGEVVNTLAALNDVDASLPDDGDILQYDTATGDFIAGELPLDDLTNVNTTGITDGQVLAWDEAAQSFIPANNATSDVFVGDVIGSVYADDSTQVIDGLTGEFVADINSRSLRTKEGLNIIANHPDVEVAPGSKMFLAEGYIGGGAGEGAGLGISIKGARGSYPNPNSVVEPGDSLMDIVSNGYDGTAFQPTAAIKLGVDKYKTVSSSGVPGRIIFATYKETGGFGLDTVMVYTSDGRLSIGAGDAPTAKLQVQGTGKFSGDVEAASFKGSLMMDDSTTIVDGITGTVAATGWVQFGSYSDAEITLVDPVNGMVYYNSTDNRFRGYQNGGWINLDDGTAG
jgi:hypothetical protein